MRAAAMATVIAMAAFRALVPLMGRASASRLDRQLADHSGIVVAGHVAGELQGGRLGERPDDLRSLARLPNDAVRVVVLHGLAAHHVHLHLLARKSVVLGKRG